MADQAQLTPQAHRQQIEAYIAVRPCYLTYADALKRALEKACPSRGGHLRGLRLHPDFGFAYFGFSPLHEGDTSVAAPHIVLPYRVICTAICQIDADCLSAENRRQSARFCLPHISAIVCELAFHAATTDLGRVGTELGVAHPPDIRNRRLHRLPQLLRHRFRENAVVGNPV